MKLGLSAIQESIDEIPSTIQGVDHPDIKEIRVWDQNVSQKSGIAYIGTEEQLFGGNGKRIICSYQDACLVFETEDLSLILNAVLNCFSHYAEWIEQCDQLIEQGCALGDLLAAAESVLGHPLLIVDESQFIIGMSPKAVSHSNTVDWADAVKNRSISAETLRCFNQTHWDSFQKQTIFHLPADFFPAPSSCRHIMIDQERIGTMIMIEDCYSLTPGQAQLAEQFIPSIARWLQTCKENDSSVQGISILAKLLDGAPDANASLKRRLSLSGWKPDDNMILITAKSMSASIHFDSYLSRILSNEMDGVYSIPYDRHLLILVDIVKKEWSHYCDDLARLLQHNHYCGAFSVPFPDIAQIPKQYQFTRKVLDRCLPEMGKLYDCRQFSLEFLITSNNSATHRTLLHPLPGILRCYDQAHGTEYAATLFCFLRCERNHTRTAEQLFIHRNTLFIRLRKIMELWNPDLEQEEERFLLLYTFYQQKYTI